MLSSTHLLGFENVPKPLPLAAVGPAFVCGPVTLWLCIQIMVLLFAGYLNAHFWRRTFLFRL